MAQAIGRLTQSVGSVTAIGRDGAERKMNIGSHIFEGEVLSARGAGSNADITFNNGCSMSLGHDESALIDETVYKLEFFDDAKVEVDLENADEEIVDLGQSLDGITITENDLIESQVDKADIAERIDFETTSSLGVQNTKHDFSSQKIDMQDYVNNDYELRQSNKSTKSTIDDESTYSSDSTLTAFNFESLEDVQRIDLSEDFINKEGLSLADVMQMSGEDNRLEIISGEHDEHILKLNNDDWAIKMDAQGNEISFKGDNGSIYNIYSSTDSNNEYELIIDEMVTIVLES